jgi:cysteine-S-conjugate beta-lyase
MSQSNRYSESTRLVHGARHPELPRTPAPPVQRGSTVLLPSASALYDSSHVNYGRGGLATHQALRDALAELEHAERVFLFPSGLAAITGTLQALTSSGDEVLVCDSVYNPTRRFLSGTMQRFGVTARYFDPAADVATIAAMITPATRLIYLESPGSLSFEMLDVPAIAQLARSRGLLTMIDNTYAAGVLFKPLDHGIDVSIQALTKYVCGHSDVFMGAASVRGEVAARLAQTSYEVGWSVSSDDAYQALRGLRTLHTRLAHHGASALKVATWLAQQPEVHSVLCPALPNFRGHDLWRRDFSGICGLIGAVMHPVSSTAIDAMLDSLRLFGLGYSWGGFESLAISCDPQLQSRHHCGSYAGPLLRFHIGLESVDDLIADLRQGLDHLALACSEASPLAVNA